MNYGLKLLLPKDKPPLMAIIFPDHGSGSITNSDLVDQHNKKEYSVVIEVSQYDLNIRLICQEIVTVRFYNGTTYNPEQLKSWLYVIEVTKAPIVNFCHAYMENDKMKLITSMQRKNFVLKVNKCEILVRKGVTHLRVMRF